MDISARYWPIAPLAVIALREANGQRTTRFEDDAVRINDLKATILHQLGIDHRHLTFRFQDLDHRLTGVEEAQVVEKIMS